MLALFLDERQVIHLPNTVLCLQAKHALPETVSGVVALVLNRHNDITSFHLNLMISLQEAVYNRVMYGQ